MTLVDFVSFYYQVYTQKARKIEKNCTQLVDVPYHVKLLPGAIKCGNCVFTLKLHKESFWRTRGVSAMANSEAFYY